MVEQSQASEGDPRAKTDRQLRDLVVRVAQRTGDEKLEALVTNVAHTTADMRIFRGPRYVPTPDERRVDQPYIEVPPDVPIRQLPGESAEEHLNRLLREAVATNLGGVRMAVIGADNRVDTLSRAEVRRFRTDKWDRVLCHLAGVPTPIMGWRGHPEGTVRVFVFGGDPAILERWDEVWARLAQRPELVLGLPAMTTLMAAAGGPGFTMTAIEPGCTRRGVRSALSKLSAERAQRVVCEIRHLTDVASPLWREAADAGNRDELLAAAEQTVAELLPRRASARIESYPEMLACWLLERGYGELEPSSRGEVATQLYGDNNDDTRAKVRDHGKSIDRLLNERRQ